MKRDRIKGDKEQFPYLRARKPTLHRPGHSVDSGKIYTRRDRKTIKKRLKEVI